LADHLHEFTGATSIYVGKLAQPIRGFGQGLREDDDDEAHIIPKAQTEIQLLHADADHQSLVDQVLRQGQGVTFERLFSAEAEKEEEEAAKEPNANDVPKHIVIDEVVREPKMHYYRVPRLGSYMAIKLEYNSCLFEDAYDEAIANYEHINNLRKEQEQEKAEHELQQAGLARAAADVGDDYEPEERTWAEFNYAAF